VAALAGWRSRPTLAAMLERVEPEVGQSRDVAAGGVHAEDPTLIAWASRDREGRTAAHSSVLGGVSTSGDRGTRAGRQPTLAG